MTRVENLGGGRRLVIPNDPKRKPYEVTVTHVMADGSVRDSVEGYVVPYNEITAPAYDLAVTIAYEKMKGLR